MWKQLETGRESFEVFLKRYPRKKDNAFFV